MQAETLRSSKPKLRLLGAYVGTVVVALAVSMALTGRGQSRTMVLTFGGMLLALLAGVSATCTA